MEKITRLPWKNVKFKTCFERRHCINCVKRSTTRPSLFKHRCYTWRYFFVSICSMWNSVHSWSFHSGKTKVWTAVLSQKEHVRLSFINLPLLNPGDRRPAACFCLWLFVTSLPSLLTCSGDVSSSEGQQPLRSTCSVSQDVVEIKAAANNRSRSFFYFFHI